MTDGRDNLAGGLLDADERQAMEIPEPILPSQWVERHRRIRRGQLKGPWRNDNAPMLRGIMDIASRPGVVQVNVRKAGQMGGSEVLRTLIGFWAHVDPDPMGLTLPNRDKGRGIVKSDVLPLFRHTDCLRDLIGRDSRDALIESITLLNGFQLDLMWSGSSASMASNSYRRVVNDEVDKFEPWRGEEPDAIAATEVRLTSYGDRRCQVNISTPTTTAGTIHRLFEDSTAKLLYHVPCPHCGKAFPLRWRGIRWLGYGLAAECLTACEEAEQAGLAEYSAGGTVWRFDNHQQLVEHRHWLAGWRDRMRDADPKDQAALIAAHRETCVWYQCPECGGRIMPRQKAAAIRSGYWSTAEGFVTDAAGVRHADAEQVTRWPHETRVGFQLTGLTCLWLHWGTLVSEWIRGRQDPAALFFFVTNRLGEPFEFRSRRVEEVVFSGKCRGDRGALDVGVVPRWAWVLLATVDTQIDGFYAVVRAWGAAMRSARVWHGKLMTFDELDRLVFARQWPVEGGEFPPMTVTRTLIDSGGTADRILETTRTQQVYLYAIPRQPYVTAIKGAGKPGVGLYWPMRNPMGGTAAKADTAALRAMMVDTHRANDLLSELIGRGMPAADPQRPAGGADLADVLARGAAQAGGAVEAWMLNRHDDAEYNAHMAAVQRTVDPVSKAEIWTPRGSGIRHDYRDCEAYQIVAAYLANVHLLPADEQQVLEWKRQQAAPPPTEKRERNYSGSDGWASTPL